MTAFIPIITALAQAILPLVPRLVTGNISLADAKAEVDAAIAQYQADASNLLAVLAANDAKADAAARAAGAENAVAAAQAAAAAANRGGQGSG